MQEDKQNKQIRSAIDGLDQLPEGFSFNSQRTWNGIEEKLPGKKEKKAAWFYAAAAVILLMGASYFTFFRSPVKKTVEAIPVVADVKSIASPVQKENKNVVAGNSRIPSNKPSNHTTATKQKTTLSPAAIKETDQTESTNTPVTAMVETNAAPVVIPEPVKEEKKIPVVTNAKKPVAKKYRIIHLNDLDAPVPQDKSNLTKSEIRKIMNQQIEEKELLQPSDNNSKSLFFFKTKSSNTSTNTIVENN